MSTPPLTLVAGEIRMPRLRPLELVSRSLGREWSLVPPNVSLRVELKALYAAVMRTFCMSATAIRSMCRWDPQSLREQPLAAAAPAPAPRFEREAFGLDLRQPVRPFERRHRQWNTIAGGACAIGGAAAIAWLVANHSREPASPTLAAAPEATLSSRAQLPVAGGAAGQHSRSGSVERAADAPPAWNRARGDLAARTPDHAVPADTSWRTAGRGTSAANTSRSLTERTPGNAARAIDTYASVSPRNARPSDIGRLAPHARESRSTKRERDASSNAGVRHARHAAVRLPEIAPLHAVRTSSDAPYDTPLASLHRSRPLPSAAGAYSPLMPSARVDSDYDSISTSAGTHVHDTAPGRTNRGRVDTDSTEWMNHMSQRRITEIPERFSK